MSVKSNEEYEQQREHQVSRLRAVLMYIMGAVFIFIGLFLIFRDQMNWALNKRFPPDMYDKIYGIVAAVYGGWRIYRAYKIVHPQKNFPDA